jgi:hypothetical protein
MSIMKNPYGVGMAGNDVVQLKSNCRCSGLAFAFRTPRTAQVVPDCCEACTGHQPDGGRAERLAALEDHAHRALERIQRAMEAAGELAKERDSALERDKMSRRVSYGSHQRRERAEKRLGSVLGEHHGNRIRGNLRVWPGITVPDYESAG